MSEFAVVIALALAGAAAVAQSEASRRALRRIPPPGRWIEVAGRRCHLVDRGAGSLTVVLESGIAASSLSWSRVAPEVARFARVVSYDRAGFGWSSAGSGRRTSNRLATELGALLEAAGIAGPYVLVGHSFGGFIVRSFAALNPAQVAGLVLVDTIEPPEWLALDAARRRMLRGGVALSYVGAGLARLGVVRACLALVARGSTAGPRQFLGLFGTEAASVVERIIGEVQKLPPELLPAVRMHWSEPRSFRAMAGHLRGLPDSAAEIAALPGLPDVPVAVLSAANLPAERLDEHSTLARRFRQGRHVVAARGGHWLHLDEPELVVTAIREVVAAARERR